MRALLHLDHVIQSQVRDVLLVLEPEEIISHETHPCPLPHHDVGAPGGHWPQVGSQCVCSLGFVCLKPAL